jgi:2-polyprenyl-6-methoxyphenol hydroxylase-like FAD-dependent oxidoreductase
VAAIAPPDIFAAIRDAEPIDDILPFRFPANIRQRCERLRRFPAGYLVIGDALYSMNPAYALGMSSSLLHAPALRDALADGDRDLARRFFRSAAVTVNMVWQATIGGAASKARRGARSRLRRAGGQLWTGRSSGRHRW